MTTSKNQPSAPVPDLETALDRSILPVDVTIVPEGEQAPEKPTATTVSGAMDFLKNRFSGAMGKH